jgi:hypothetical protein
MARELLSRRAMRALAFSFGVLLLGAIPALVGCGSDASPSSADPGAPAPSSSGGTSAPPSKGNGAPANGSDAGADAAKGEEVTKPCPSANACIEADLELPDGKKVHLSRIAVVAIMPSLGRIALGTVQNDDELGITIVYESANTKPNVPYTPVPKPQDGVTVSVHDHVKDAQGKMLPSLTGESGTVLFTSVGAKAGDHIQGTLTGIVAKRAGTGDTVKITSGSFAATVP